MRTVVLPVVGLPGRTSFELPVGLRPARRNREKTLRRVRMESKGGSEDLPGGNSPSPSTESLFLKELRRRGLTSDRETARQSDSPSSSSPPSSSSVIQPGEDVPRGNQPGGTAQPGGGQGEKTDGRKTGGGGGAPGGDSQLAKSRSLNSEGLEGLIPRAIALVRLGASFPLNFLPLAALIVTVFCALYLYFGDDFLHSKRSTGTGPPPYIDPYALLQEDANMPLYRPPIRN